MNDDIDYNIIINTQLRQKLIKNQYLVISDS